jgi:hypothetical protein
MPDPEVFGERLLEMTKYLQGQNSSEIPVFRTGVFAQHRNDLEDMDFFGDWSFEFDPHWEVKLGDPAEADRMGIERPDFDDSNAFAVIGGNVNVEDGKFKQYSFSLSILVEPDAEIGGESEADDAEDPCCWNEYDDEPRCEWRLARRYHFDIDLGDDDNESKPITHLQIGGNSQIQRTPEGHQVHYCSTPLDKPRIPYPPMDPVLLLHMLLTQYPTISSANQGTWYDQVTSSEELLWDNYHGWLANTDNRDDRSKPFANLLFNDNDNISPDELVG